MQLFEITIWKSCKMKPKNMPKELRIGVELESFLDKDHQLYRLSNIINWDYLMESIGPYYVENNGRPGVPTRVIAGLHYLKYLENESDESVVEKFCENPYWQYFCGYKTFQHELPCHPTTLVKWRNRIGIEGVEKLLSETINTAKREGLLPEKLCRRVNVDTTVQEKAITFPTDAKLFYRMRINLVKAADKRDVNLRQSYHRVGKYALLNQNRYAHARQMKRAQRELKKLKNYLGRVTRDIIRKVPSPDAELSYLLNLATRLFKQKRDDKNKLYSLHAPEVECIAKGKAKSKYEFGCKVAVTTTCKDPWVVSIFAEHGNPYDGHTLQKSLNQSERLTQVKIEDAFVDRGYRGKENHPKDTRIFVSGTKRLPLSLKKLLRARSGIEPIIGHLKGDHGLDRNYLLGKTGDMINAALTGCAFNLKKIMRLLPDVPAFA